MDGRLNCGLDAQSAAHTKIRHLENQVRETIEQVDRLGDQVLEINNALDDHITQVSEQLDTNKVIADIVDADTVEATNVTSDNVNTLDLTATTIEAETISVDNLENVNVLHGQTVDVNKTIANIGQFTETQTTTANNSTTNTTELNVDGETNLIGTTVIDGDLVFTKDNGLSKLEGNYLDIEASNIAIDNKNGDERTSLLVKNVDSLVEFEGKLKVHNDTELENLTVNKEAYLEDAYLDNPTFENIKQTQEVSSTCIDLDEDGKFIRVNIGTSSEVVSTALKSVVDGVEKVNISAEGATFNVPVTTENITVNEKATVTEIESSIISAEILTTEEAVVDTMTFYNGEWYDSIIVNEQEFIDFFSEPKAYNKDTYNVLITNSLVFSPENVPTDITAPQDGVHNVYFDKNGTISFTNSETYPTANVLSRMYTIFEKSVLHNGQVYCRANHAYFLNYLSMIDGNVYVDDSTTSTDTTEEFTSLLLLNNLTNVNVEFYAKYNGNATNWGIQLSNCKYTYVTSKVGPVNVKVNSISFVNNTENCTVKAANLRTGSSTFTISTNEYLNTVIDDNSASTYCFGEITTSNYMSFVNGKQYDKIVYNKAQLYAYMKEPVFIDKRYNVLFIGPTQVEIGDDTEVSGAIGIFKKQVNLYTTNNVKFRLISSDINYVPAAIFNNIEFYNCNFQIPNGFFVKNGLQPVVTSFFKLKGCSMTISSMLPSLAEYNISFKECKDLEISFYAESGNSTITLESCENVYLSTSQGVTSDTPTLSNCDRCNVVINNSDTSYTVFQQSGPGSNMVYDKLSDTILTPTYHPYTS